MLSRKYWSDSALHVSNIDTWYNHDIIDQKRRIMKRIIYTCVIIAFILMMGCEESSEPKVYNHTDAYFSVTCPGGWSLISEDSEMYEFRKGDVKLIEVGGFDFGGVEEFIDMPDEQFKEFMRSASLDGLEGYCEEAEIRDWTIMEQYHTTWGGMAAYRIRAQGFSDAADVDMVLDLLAALNLKNGMLYMLASQIAKSQYEGTKADVETVVNSFKVN